AAEHLADDYLQVLVGNILALLGEYSEDFVHDVALRGFDALQAHQLMQIDGTVGQTLAGGHVIAVADDHLLEAGDLVADDGLFGRADSSLLVAEFNFAGNRRNERAGTVVVIGNDVADGDIRAGGNFGLAAVKFEFDGFGLVGSYLDDVL